MVNDILRAEREKQNLTIKDVEKGTSIRGIYIEAIENGEYNKLPGEVYAKGFIRNYATFLKLDADDIILNYTQENHPEEIAKAEAAKAAEEKNKEREKKAKAKEKTVDKKPQSAEKKTELRQQVESSHKKQSFMLIAAIILAVIGGAFYFTSGSGSEEKPAAAPAPVETKAEEVPVKPAVPEKKVDGVELVAKFTDRCWTQVDVDGKTIFEGIVEKGKTETWKGKENVVITAGNAGAVELKLNGKDLGKLGNTGEVIEKTYGPNGESAKQPKQ